VLGYLHSTPLQAADLAALRARFIAPV
jgi:hypothetical protein